MDAVRLQWIKDMTNANLLIHKREALVYEDGAVVGIDTDKLHKGFVELYADLTSVGYARGWI